MRPSAGFGSCMARDRERSQPSRRGHPRLRPWQMSEDAQLHRRCLHKQPERKLGWEQAPDNLDAVRWDQKAETFRRPLYEKRAVYQPNMDQKEKMMDAFNCPLVRHRSDRAGHSLRRQGPRGLGCWTIIAADSISSPLSRVDSQIPAREPFKQTSPYADESAGASFVQ
jgi:hypothetical protein